MNSVFPRALIFDWDNTLVDSWDAIYLAINQVRAHFGMPAWSMTEIKANCTRAARDSFPEWFGDRWQEAYDYYYKRFDDVRKTSAIRALPGSEELLRWLKTENIPAYVVSNKHGAYLRLEAARLKWEDLFVNIVGAQDAARDKPAREPVDLALYKDSIKADKNVWFIGDSEVDVQCARNAGCTPVLIGAPELSARLSVAQCFSNCNELFTLLCSIARS